MDILSSLGAGFLIAFSLQNLAYCLVGVTLGTLIGVLPGIGSLAAVSMLLPVTFYLEPTTALVMLAGVFYGAEYGGSTASILLNLPGTPSSAVTCLDGYPMTRQGRAGVALCITTIASFIGAAIGIVILTFFSPYLAYVSRNFTSAEYFSVILLGLITAATITSGSAYKGLVMIVVGLLLGTVGTDISSGALRFTMGVSHLYDGFGIVVVAMGLFGVSEVVASINMRRGEARPQRVRLRDLIPTRQDLKEFFLPAIRGSGIGAFIGALPGAGQTIASFMSYAVEKRLSRTPERFGHGAIAGISAPEASNNAASITAFVPTLTLGIPGSATMALILGALLIHGITPGPNLIPRHPEIFWGLVASFWIGNILLVILNLPLVNLWVRMIQLPYNILYPIIIVLICVGVFAVNLNTVDVLFVILFGLAGYLMKIYGFEPAPLLLGFVLGPLLEENLRRTLLVNRGEILPILERPITAIFLALCVAVLLWTVVSALRSRKRGVPA